MRPAGSSRKDHPTAEVQHQARGMCKACYARDYNGRDHLNDEPIRVYGVTDPEKIKRPMCDDMLARLDVIHPPTADYIRRRRRRGIPAEGRPRKVAA